MVFLNEFNGFVEPDCVAITLEFFRLAVSVISVVIVIVSPVIPSVSDDTAFMDQNLLESSILRPEGIVVAKMPLAEDTCFVAG